MWLPILTVVALLLALIVYTIYGHRRHMASSTGQKITPAERPNTALLLIDLQEDFTSPSGKYSYPADMVENVVAAINDLVEIANAKGFPVISIRQTFQGWYINFLVRIFNQGRGCAKSGHLDLDDRINGDIDHDIVKAHADAFGEPELERVLDRQSVGKLIIVGLDGDYCVQATIQAALNRGYDVSFSDATTLALNPASWQQTKSRLVSRGAKDTINQHAPQKPSSCEKEQDADARRTTADRTNEPA